MPFFRIPDLSESFFSYGKTDQKPWDGQEFKLLIWNVFKASGHRQGPVTFREDFQRLTQKKALILLQEGLWNPQSPPPSWLIENRDHYHWKLASSFEYRKSLHHTGVITGSLFQNKNYQLLRSSSRELFIFTPKMTLVSEYQISNLNETLLVLNTHTLNFTLTDVFKNFIREILIPIQNHRGPVILAGDFNTWSAARMQILTEVLYPLGLRKYDFSQDPRWLKLDHIFIRDLEIKSAEILNNIASSDHYPLELTLQPK